MGFMTSDPVLYSHSPAAEIQRQVIRTKILGNVNSIPAPYERERIKESETKAAKVQQSKSDAIAKKARTENIDRAAEMRHLRYEIIKDADIIQVSVINSEDGTIIRKVPPDKVVGFVKKFREKSLSGKIKRKNKLDIQA